MRKGNVLIGLLISVVPMIFVSSSNWWNSTYAIELDNILEKSTVSYLKHQPNWPLYNSAADNDTLALSISGYIDLSNLSVNLNPFIISKSSQFTNQSNDSPFRIELLGDNGDILSVFPFSPKLSTALLDTNNTSALISEAIPYINGTKKIVLLKDDLELGSRYVSKYVPEVNIISPKGGEFFNKSMTINWRAQDQDGDDLAYFLFYSNDEGRSWQSIASNLHNTTRLNIDVETLPGNTVSPSIFRIIATDGVNTAFDDSNAITIPPRPHH